MDQIRSTVYLTDPHRGGDDRGRVGLVGQRQDEFGAQQEKDEASPEEAT